MKENVRCFASLAVQQWTTSKLGVCHLTPLYICDVKIHSTKCKRKCLNQTVCIIRRLQIFLTKIFEPLYHFMTMPCEKHALWSIINRECYFCCNSWACRLNFCLQAFNIVYLDGFLLIPLKTKQMNEYHCTKVLSIESVVL